MQISLGGQLPLACSNRAKDTIADEVDCPFL
jgi:hypothetical protein